MTSQDSSPEEILKKLREGMEKSLKEGQSIAQSAQQSMQAMNKLSDELKKLSEELKKPPKTTTKR
ncbi:MAG: hypothetical protein RXO54_04120 [Acidilobus sp.]